MATQPWNAVHSTNEQGPFTMPMPLSPSVTPAFPQHVSRSHSPTPSYISRLPTPEPPQLAASSDNSDFLYGRERRLSPGGFDIPNRQQSAIVAPSSPTLAQSPGWRNPFPSSSPAPSYHSQMPVAIVSEPHYPGHLAMPSPTGTEPTGHDSPLFLAPGANITRTSSMSKLSDHTRYGQNEPQGQPEMRLTYDGSSNQSGDDINDQFIREANRQALAVTPGEVTAQTPTTTLANSAINVQYCVIVNPHINVFPRDTGSMSKDVSLVSQHGSVKARLRFEGVPRVVCVSVEAGKDWKRSGDVELDMLPSNYSANVYCKADYGSIKIVAACLSDSPTQITAQAQGNVTVLLPADFGGRIEIEGPTNKKPNFKTGLKERLVLKHQEDPRGLPHKSTWFVASGKGPRDHDILKVTTKRGRVDIGVAPQANQSDGWLLD